MEFYLSAVLLGLAFCSMGFGIYISLRIFNIPDITTDGSYTLSAVAAYGADMYQWGFQAGEQAAQYFQRGNLNGLKPELVNVGKKVFNAEVAKEFNISFDSSFEAMK